MMVWASGNVKKVPYLALPQHVIISLNFQDSASSSSSSPADANTNYQKEDCSPHRVNRKRQKPATSQKRVVFFKRRSANHPISVVAGDAPALVKRHNMPCFPPPHTTPADKNTNQQKRGLLLPSRKKIKPLREKSDQ